MILWKNECVFVPLIAFEPKYKESYPTLSFFLGSNTRHAKSLAAFFVICEGVI